MLVEAQVPQINYPHSCNKRHKAMSGVALLVLTMMILFVFEELFGEPDVMWKFTV